MSVINMNNFDFGLETSEAVFPVSTRPIAAVGKAGATLDIATHKAVIRSDAKGNITPLGVVGRDYKLVPHKDYFAPMEEAITRLVEPRLLEGVTVETHTAHGGSYAERAYVFPAFAEELKTSAGFATDIGFRITAWNGLAGDYSAGMASGLYDWFCKNGCITGSLADLVKRKHTSGMTPEFFTSRIDTMLSTINDEIALLRRKAVTELDREAAENIIKVNFSERRAAKVIEQLDEEIQTRGNNVFALESALTFYGSHDSERFGVRNTGADNIASTLHDRSAQVAKIMQSAPYMALLEAA